MKTFVIESPRNLVVEEQPLKLLESTVKVKITRALITETDLALYAGKDQDKLPVVPCRIATGLVSEASDTSVFHKGERVLLSPYLADKVHGFTCNGFLRDYAIVPEEYLISLPEGISDDESVLADYVALATECLNVVDIKKHEYIVILGTGTFSLILAQLAAYYRSIPILVGKNEEHLEFAENMGISYRINSDKQDVQQRIMEITSGLMANCTVFECVQGINPQYALTLTAEGGNVCVAGFSAYTNKLSVDMRSILNKGLRVIGVTSGKENLMSAINLLANKVVDVNGLVQNTVDFDNTAEAFEKMCDSDEDSKDIYVLID